MKRHLGIALGLLLAVAALSGCGKSTKPASLLGANGGGTNGATPVDVAQANDAVTASAGLINEDQYTTSAQTPMQFSAGGLSLGRPIHWWRTIDSTARTVDITYEDLDSLGRPITAIATIHRRFVGTFNIVAGDTGVVGKPDSTLRVIRKPLDDLWTRKLMLHRFRADSTSPADSSHKRVQWRVVGTSGVTVTSAGATTEIVSLRIQAGKRDTTVTDPLQLARMPRILWISPRTSVTVTVTTGRANDIVALYHGSERRKFTSNGDNTYSITFVAGDFAGLRHFGVNAFSNGTLLDNTAPYDSQVWVLPFGARDRDCNVDRH